MANQSPPSPRPRKTRKSWNEPGHAHFLTYSCHQRLRLLSKDRSRQWVVDTIRAARIEMNFAVWAYVIMPEHVHILVYPKSHVYDMGHIMVALKKPVAVAARRHLEETHATDWIRRLSVTYPSRTVFRFWQPGGGFDHNVFKEHTVSEIIDYIHNNPVRRGLVNSPTDWKWSSARYWHGQSDALIQMDEPFV